MSSKSRLAKVTLATDAEPGSELVKWSCKEGYIYVPIPSAGSAGHRADKWDVDKWFKALRVELVAIDDNMLVRLTDQETADLFAECPLPSDGTSLTTAVEPVIDSSRYFVLRIVDKDTGKHAFVGLGFRERGDASGFTAGLDEYHKYVKRKQEADKMKAEFERQESGEGGPTRDYSLKENITLKIGSMKHEGREGASSSMEGRSESKAAAEAAAQAVGALKLAPPPPPPGRGAPAATAATAAAAAMPSGGSAATQAEADDWGDFTGTGYGIL